MKILKITLILTLFSFFCLSTMAKNTPNIYNYDLVDIDGNKVYLSKFKGKPILLVNTASRCGFTPQYEGLQNLFTKYSKTDLTIIAATSNSFNQEYDDPEDIKKICLVNYDISFITSSPIEVKGNNAHPIFNWLNEEYNKKANSLRKKVIDYQSQRRASLDKIASQRAESRETLLKKINPIVDTYIKENNISLVLDKNNTLGGNPKFDITKVIVEKLNKELPSLNLK